MSGELKINIGCGVTASPGWLNIDKSPTAWLAKHRLLRWLLHKVGLIPEHIYRSRFRRDIRIIDILRRDLPAPDSSTSWIYTSHVINSMSRDQTCRLMKEAYRALRPGGRIRIVTPDLVKVAMDWRRRADAYLTKDRPFFAQWDAPHVAIGDCFIKSLQLELYARSHLSHWQRLFDYPVVYYYDLESLTLLLRSAGFSRVEQSAYRQSKMPDVETLDVHADSLHVEAVK